VQAAEALYQRMKEEEATGRPRLTLERGRLIDTSWAGRLRRTAERGLDAAGGAALWPGLLTLPLLASLPAAWPLPLRVGTGLATAVGLGLLTQFRTNRALAVTVKDARRLAACDLVTPPSRGARGTLGELQLALGQMAVNLRSLVHDSREELAAVRGSIDEIVSGNHELSARTESQASSLQETAATMEEINGTIKQSTDAAERGARLAGETTAITQECATAVGKVEAAMHEIKSSSARVADIVQVIEGVAFQTNLLALNAAVEAARAGESGRGFAVVAGEVRALASRTSEAAAQIRQLIADSSARVEVGVQDTSHAARRMGDALLAVGRVSEVLDGVSAAAAEQRLGVGQVNDAVANLDSVTQQNAAMVEELAASASAVGHQARQVEETMAMFRLNEADASLAAREAAALRAQAKANLATAAALADGSGFSLEQAIEAHVAWRTKLRNAVLQHEQVDVAKVSRDDQCPLGCWLHGPGGSRWGHLPEFSQLLGDHAAFHKEVGAIGRQINSGNQAGALAAMNAGTPFTQRTQTTVRAIRALKLKVEGGEAGRGAATRSAAPAASGGGGDYVLH
jgi:methyl-accepting chemotaxis protein